MTIVFALMLSTALPFNRVQQKHTHNSYDRVESLLDQVVYYSVRSVELDLLPSDRAGDWYVEHGEGGHTTCKYLSDCLAIVGSTNSVIPQHEPITIWIELKKGRDNWNDTHTPQQFDDLFRTYLGSDNLYIPNKLLTRCSCGGTGCASLQASVKSCGWPPLDQLQKKFFVAMLQAESGGTSYYEDNTNPTTRVAYIQGDSSKPESNANRVFFNGDPDKTAQLYVTRITTANEVDSWNDAVSQGYQYLGTDKVNFYSDSWSRTNQPTGWPFRCQTPCALPTETAKMMYIDAVSGALGGTSDNFTFVYSHNGTSPPVRMTAVAGGPGSHSQSGARGCLMARGDLSAAAPYVAVCRGAVEGEKTRLQWRQVEGGGTSTREIDAAYGDQYDFLQLDITGSGGQTCVSGSAARTASAPMTQIGSICIAADLFYQGLAGSSNDSTVGAQSPRVRFLFVNLQRDGNDVSYHSLTPVNIGSVAPTASSGAGFFPGGWWFTYQTKWGTRAHGAGYGGAGQWIAQMTGSGRQDYVYNPDGTKDVNVLFSNGTALGNERTVGKRAYGSQYGATGQFFADVERDSNGACDLVYDRDDSKELRILRNNGTSLASDVLWGKRTADVADSGKRQWVVNAGGDSKLDYVYNSSSSSKEIRVLLDNGTSLGNDSVWGSRKYDIQDNAVWLVDVDGDGKADYVYNRKDSNELRILRNGGSSFGEDVVWATRTSAAGWSGSGQWVADLNGDGYPDYLYAPDGTRQLHAMLSNKGALGAERPWGERIYGVGYDGKSQWVTDLNGDCRADYVYNRDTTRELWGMLSTGTEFSIDEWWGNRAWGVGYDGNSEWFGHLQNNGLHDQINNRDGDREYWVMVPQSTQSSGCEK